MKKMKKLQVARWAELDNNGQLYVYSGKREKQMKNSDGTGSPLLKENKFGADVIRFSPGEGVKNHTHLGSHILFVIKGTGYVIFEDEPQWLEPGLCYLVPSMAKHAIEAKTELVLIAVGNDHREVSSFERMELVA